MQGLDGKNSALLRGDVGELSRGTEEKDSNGSGGSYQRESERDQVFVLLFAPAQRLDPLAGAARTVEGRSLACRPGCWSR